MIGFSNFYKGIIFLISAMFCVSSLEGMEKAMFQLEEEYKKEYEISAQRGCLAAEFLLKHNACITNFNLGKIYINY